MSMVRSGGGISRREPCKKCGNPVFLAERLNVDNHLYHRTCFRCARCSNQLSLANYYETEDGQYCCETCPDEETISPTTKSIDITDYQQNTLLLKRSVSDEEKEQKLQIEKLNKDQITTSAFSKARNHFISSQLNVVLDEIAKNEEVYDSEECSSLDEDPPDLPNTEPPDILETLTHSNQFLMETESVDNTEEIKAPLTPTTVIDLEDELLKQTNDSKEEIENKNASRTSLDTFEFKPDDNRNETIGGDIDKDIVVNNENSNISVKCNKISDNTDDNEPLADSVTILDDRQNNTDFVTKEEANTVTITNDVEHDTKSQQSPKSLVLLRKQQFESTNKDIAMVTKIDSKLASPSNEPEKNKIETKSSIEELSEPLTESQQPLEQAVPSSIEETEVKNREDHVEVASVRSQNSNSEEQIVSNVNTILNDKGIKTDQESISDQKPDKEKSQIEEDYPAELNPFGDDDEDEETTSITQQSQYTPMKSTEKLDSTNPFGSTDEDEEEPVPLRKQSTPLTKSPVPKVSLNPFLSEDEESSDDEHVHAAVNTRPVPKPRSIRSDTVKTPEPTQRLHKQEFSRNTALRGSASSLDSSFSGKSSQTPTGTYRKKKPAPPPPTAKEMFLSPDHKPSPSHRTSTTPGKIRKNRPAPPPPTTPSPVKQTSDNINNSGRENIAQTVEAQNTILISQISPTKSTNSTNSELEKEKNSKDEKNRNRQSAILSSASSVKTIASSTSSEGDMSSMQILPPNKSTYGKWKRKKGPAPPRPLPQRRQINVLSADELRRQLDIIEIQQQGLEKQGVKLEQLIREKCEGPGVEEDAAISPEVEDLVLQLFELVNEKNELFRKQAELMYLRRQQRLEEEHADLEYQIRCLMERPERNKTDYDKAREEELINRLIEVVERRNEIVECLEMDRIREAEEDESINMHLNLLAAKREEDKQSVASSQDSVKLSKKEKKKQKKIKKNKGVTIDVDKDVDETEITSKKEKKKKKWLF